jgi:hypothetical protein
MATMVDVAEEVKNLGRDCADLEFKLRKGEVFWRGVRLATVRRPRLSMNRPAYANATRCAQSIVQTSSECWLCRGRIGRGILDGFFDCLGSFVRKRHLLTSFGRGVDTPRHANQGHNAGNKLARCCPSICEHSRRGMLSHSPENGDQFDGRRQR